MHTEKLAFKDWLVGQMQAGVWQQGDAGRVSFILPVQSPESEQESQEARDVRSMQAILPLQFAGTEMDITKQLLGKEENPQEPLQMETLHKDEMVAGYRFSLPESMAREAGLNIVEKAKPSMQVTGDTDLPGRVHSSGGITIE